MTNTNIIIKHIYNMKKFYLLFLCLVFPFVVNAQHNRKHMDFLGVPITGTVSEVAKQLRTKGFVFDDSFNEEFHAILHGTYLGYPCSINIGHDKDGLVLNILLKYKEIQSFKTIDSTIAYFKKKLESIYGNFSQAFDGMSIYNKDLEYGHIEICSTWVDSDNYKSGTVVCIIFADKIEGEKTIVNGQW